MQSTQKAPTPIQLPIPKNATSEERRLILKTQQEIQNNFRLLFEEINALKKEIENHA